MRWNYTTVLNIVFLALGALLVWGYFTRGGGLRMLKAMNTPAAHEHAHGDGHAQASFSEHGDPMLMGLSGSQDLMPVDRSLEPSASPGRG